MHIFRAKQGAMKVCQHKPCENKEVSQYYSYYLSLSYFKNKKLCKIMGIYVFR